jgi:hypothetical protein
VGVFVERCRRCAIVVVRVHRVYRLEVAHLCFGHGRRRRIASFTRGSQLKACLFFALSRRTVGGRWPPRSRFARLARSDKRAGNTVKSGSESAFGRGFKRETPKARFSRHLGGKLEGVAAGTGTAPGPIFSLMLVACGLRAGSASGGPWAPRAGRAAHWQARLAKARQVARDPQPETLRLPGGHCQCCSRQRPRHDARERRSSRRGRMRPASRRPEPRTGPRRPKRAAFNFESQQIERRRHIRAVLCSTALGDDTREQRNIRDARGAAG